ncbi:DZANK-type domain-containing protein [Paenibacillus glucanolyticus]|jgi:ribosomal protein L37E
MGDKPVLKPCIRCGRIPGEEDEYCSDCGVPILNRCSDEPGIFGKGCTFVNPPTAVYCTKCGEPTVYQLNGLIQPKYPNGNRPKSSDIN